MRILSLAVVCVLFAACSKPEAAKEPPKDRVNEESIAKAKTLVKGPVPLAEVKPKLVEVFGEPTAKDGETLIWAGIDGSKCFDLKLVVSKGEASGTISGSVHKALEEPYAKCLKLAGK